MALGRPTCYSDPENSEVSESFLQRLSSSASIVNDFEDALKYDEKGNFAYLQYDELKKNFSLGDLVCQYLVLCFPQ